LHIVEKAASNSTTGVEAHTKSFIFGESIDELLLYINVSPNPDEQFFAHSDHLGSILALVDDSGAIQESYRYTEFGETFTVDDSFSKLAMGTNSPVGNPHAYTGCRQSTMLGNGDGDWYDYRMRHYRPGLGRFVQRDPMEYIDGSSRYVYVRNAPIQYSDPLGLMVGAVDDWEKLKRWKNRAVKYSREEARFLHKFQSKMGVWDSWEAWATWVMHGLSAESIASSYSRGWDGNAALGPGMWDLKAGAVVNAMQHCILSCLLSLVGCVLEGPVGEWLLWNHETASSEGVGDRLADEANNRKGTGVAGDIGSRSEGDAGGDFDPEDACEKGCRKLLRSRELDLSGGGPPDHYPLGWGYPGAGLHGPPAPGGASVPD